MTGLSSEEARRLLPLDPAFEGVATVSGHVCTIFGWKRLRRIHRQGRCKAKSLARRTRKEYQRLCPLQRRSRYFWRS